MSSGWYKQLRNIPERTWFKDANVVLLYTYLKATAYVTDGKYEGIIVRRGSCPTTRAEMMEATGLSRHQVDTSLKKLIGFGEIFVKGYSKFSLVTICDYDICEASNTLFDAYEGQQIGSITTYKYDTYESPNSYKGLPRDCQSSEKEQFKDKIVRRDSKKGDTTPCEHDTYKAQNPYEGQPGDRKNDQGLQNTPITTCKHDTYKAPNSYEGLLEDCWRTAGGLQREFTPIIDSIRRKEYYNNSLISDFISYKTERENSDVALEIKRRYNKIFDGILPPCFRLSTSTRISVEECLRRFGLQSVDVVFQQIKSERFSLGNNKTGFIASFTFIFTPKNYQQYLERAQLARRKKKAPAPSPSVGVISDDKVQPTPAERTEARRQSLIGMIRLLKENPESSCRPAVLAAYSSGELITLGIQWTPDNNPGNPSTPENQGNPSTPENQEPPENPSTQQSI